MAHLSGRESGEDELNSPDFPPAFFGYHRKAVDQYLQELLQSKLASAEQLSLYPDSAAADVQVDRYRELGREIGDLLRSVQDTAARIRRQAEEDAGRWRGEATMEVEKRIAEAQAAAEELRASAWEVSTEMIAQLQEVEVESYRNIEKHSQEMIAEAENESHRIREDARRRGESIRSDANVASLEVEERTRTLCDQMIDSAQQRVSAIQERVLALERHRDQLLEEIGGIRSGAAPIGVKLVDQTGALIYRPAPEVEETAHVTPRHEMSGLVRVIPQDEAEESSPADLQQPEEAASDPASERSTDDPAPGILSEDGASPTPAGEMEQTASEEGAKPQDALGGFEDLFASLRQVTPAASRSSSKQPVGPNGSADTTPSARESRRESPRMGDAEAERLQEEMLLPVANQFLRQFKRLLAEEQNRVLEGIRVGDLVWNAEEVDGRLRSHLEMLMEQSWQAGHSAAERMAGRDIARPAFEGEPERGFAHLLVADVTEAIDMVGSAENDSQRSRVASRVFRIWRSDTLESHLRDLGSKYYRLGMARSLREAGISGASMVPAGEIR
ncbi:MAG: DivIVA domain-containing protein [bacterium]|nr:DivIVA domain-containing protein [bacterium]MDE0602636.1 DivIVA domain-containing protein [bacterium]